MIAEGSEWLENKIDESLGKLEKIRDGNQKKI